MVSDRKDKHKPIAFCGAAMNLQKVEMNQNPHHSYFHDQYDVQLFSTEKVHICLSQMVITNHKYPKICRDFYV